MKYTFLVVDETPIIALGLKSILQNNLDFEIFRTTIINDAIAILNEKSIDIIFLEISFKGKKHFESIATLNAIQPNAKIIVFADSINEQKEICLLQKVKCHFISKASTQDHIVKQVKNVLQISQTPNL